MTESNGGSSAGGGREAGDPSGAALTPAAGAGLAESALPDGGAAPEAPAPSSTQLEASAPEAGAGAEAREATPAAPGPGGFERRAAVVRFRTPGQPSELAAGELELAPSALVVAESERGIRIGTVLALREQARGELQHRVLRVATGDDLEIHNRNKVREREAFAFCLERIHALGLGMKLVGVEIAHSGSSAVFSFTSGDRVDFRGLVRDLARRFHLRVDMRQIGVRDASRICGAVGVCGRPLCCATFLPVFSPISVRMAKDQNLALNQDKLSGACGRLKCCLAYEEDAYAALRKGLPKLGKRVVTPAGEGRVKDVNVVKRLVRVQLADGRYREFPGDEVRRPAEAVAGEVRQDRDEAADGGEQDLARPPAAASGPGAGDSAPPADGAAPGSNGNRKRRRRRRRRGRSPDEHPPARPEPGSEGDDR